MAVRHHRFRLRGRDRDPSGEDGLIILAPKSIMEFNDFLTALSFKSLAEGISGVSRFYFESVDSLEGSERSMALAAAVAYVARQSWTSAWTLAERGAETVTVLPLDALEIGESVLLHYDASEGALPAKVGELLELSERARSSDPVMSASYVARRHCAIFLLRVHQNAPADAIRRELDIVSRHAQVVRPGNQLLLRGLVLLADRRDVLRGYKDLVTSVLHECKYGTRPGDSLEKMLAVLARYDLDWRWSPDPDWRWSPDSDPS
jgi:hypothetical protein